MTSIRILAVLLLASLIASVPVWATQAATRTPVGGDLLASDTFDGTGATLGSNWSNNATVTVFKRVSDLATSTSTNNDTAARYSAITWPNDQRVHVVYGKVLSAGLGLGAGYGPALRMSTSGTTITYYRFICSAAGWELKKKIAGASTSLASSATPACADGDAIDLQAVGTTITAKINGTLVTTKTDSSITSGAAGMAYSSSGGGDDYGMTFWAGYTPGTPRRQRQ